MAKDFDDDMSPDTGSTANNDTCQDYSGDIAGNDGVDLNDASDPTYAELMRGYSQEALYEAGKKATELGEKPSPSTPGGAASRLGEIALPAIKPAVRAATYGVAAIAEAGFNMYKPEPRLREGIDFTYDDTGQRVPIPPLDEPLKEQDYYDAETGVMLTDEKLRE
jgi:hypothetical protein